MKYSENETYKLYVFLEMQYPVMPLALYNFFLSTTISNIDKETAVIGVDSLEPRKAVSDDSGRYMNKMKDRKAKWQPQHCAAEAKLKTRKGGTYLSMMTGSEGVSLRFPQLFLSQHRLEEREREKGKTTRLFFVH